MAGIIDSWKFAHPKDLQDGLVEINENDCLAFIFPDWKFRRLPRNISRSLNAQSNYLAEIIEQYKTGRNNGLTYRV